MHKSGIQIHLLGTLRIDIVQQGRIEADLLETSADVS